MERIHPYSFCVLLNVSGPFSPGYRPTGVVGTGSQGQGTGFDAVDHSEIKPCSAIFPLFRGLAMAVLERSRESAAVSVAQYLRQIRQRDR